MEEILKIIEEINESNKDILRIVHIDKTNWTNVITKRRQTVRDLFFLGYKNNSCNPICLNEITYKDKTYKLHGFLSHVNLSKIESGYINVKTGEVKVSYQNFCNPVTSHHVYTNPNIDKILKGQLMGQNSDSPYQHVDNVINEGYDYAIRRSDGKWLTCRTSPVELITRQTPENILNVIGDCKFPSNKNELAVKYKNDNKYRIVSKSIYESEKNEISDYYPVITYEDCKDLLNNIPKQDVDFTVIGLGSAGTGILDQVARSKYFNSYLLIDFDTVEPKNLRNQWYTSGKINRSKIEASSDIMYAINKNTKIICKNKCFQDSNLNYYKSKYVVSGFDNLDCRMELLEKSLRDFEVRYLIDLRYLDYSCSIYFIDLANKCQVKYYRNLLEADIEAFQDKVKYVKTREELDSYWESKGYYHNHCKEACIRFFGSRDCPICACRNNDCKSYLWQEFEKHQPKIELEEESSCVRENFIDIYKYSSSFVFSAIREIENGNNKPFTHIEAQTEVIPSHIIVKI